MRKKVLHCLSTVAQTEEDANKTTFLIRSSCNRMKCKAVMSQVVFYLTHSFSHPERPSPSLPLSDCQTRQSPKGDMANKVTAVKVEEIDSIKDALYKRIEVEQKK